MFDIAPSELLLVAVVALLVIGPKDLPLALRTAGRWLGKVRTMSGHFRAGIDTMIREAELAEIEKEWRDRNTRIMAEHPDAETLDATVPPKTDEPVMQPLDHPAVVQEPAAESRTSPGRPLEGEASTGEPELPLDPPAIRRRD